MTKTEHDTAMAKFKTAMREAYVRKAVHKVTTSHIRLSWFSPKRSFKNMSERIIRNIGGRVARRLAAQQTRIDEYNRKKQAWIESRGDTLVTVTGDINNHLPEK